MLSKSLLWLAALALPASGAQAEVTFKYIGAADAAKMVAAPKPPVIASSGDFSMALHMRNMPARPESHAGWDEEIIIQQGDVLLNYGGTIVNAKEISPGEIRGDSIAGGKHMLMHPGDIVTIPAGMPHQQLIQTPTMWYILFRTKKQ